MRAAAVVIDKDKILLIRRFSRGKEYYVFPGGGVENGETPEEAAIREMKEETSLDVELDKKLWEFDNKFDGRMSAFYLITKFHGKLKLGGTEAKINSKENSYILEWHNLKEIEELPLFPEEIKGKVIEEFS